MAERGVVVAIDGGNSKTDVAVVNRDGVVLATHRAHGASNHAVGIQEAVREVGSMVEVALAAAGLRLGPAEVDHVSAYLAGVDFPRERAQMMEELVAHGWSRTATVDNDSFALLRIGSPSGDGVAVVCGAGINCVAVDRDGRTVRFPSLGRISGDWGGGDDLGLEVMWAASRDEDGRGAPTLLRGAVLEHFGAVSVLDVVQRVQFGELPAARLPELAPVLFQVAESGDAVAMSIVERLASEIATYVVTSLRRLGLLEAAVPVVLGGGILGARHPSLIAGIERLVGAAAPRVAFHHVATPPLAGAVLLGLDHVGATSDPRVEATVRTHFATGRSEAAGA